MCYSNFECFENWAIVFQKSTEKIKELKLKQQFEVMKNKEKDIQRILKMLKLNDFEEQDEMFMTSLKVYTVLR